MAPIDPVAPLTTMATMAIHQPKPHLPTQPTSFTHDHQHTMKCMTQITPQNIPVQSFTSVHFVHCRIVLQILIHSLHLKTSHQPSLASISSTTTPSSLDKHSPSNPTLSSTSTPTTTTTDNTQLVTPSPPSSSLAPV